MSRRPHLGADRADSRRTKNVAHDRRQRYTTVLASGDLVAFVSCDIWAVWYSVLRSPALSIHSVQRLIAYCGSDTSAGSADLWSYGALAWGLILVRLLAQSSSSNPYMQASPRCRDTLSLTDFYARLFSMQTHSHS